MDFCLPIREIVKQLWAPLAHLFDTFKNLEQNMEKLRQEAGGLYDKRTDINREINRYRDSKMPTTECESLLKRVEDMENKLSTVEQNFNENKRWFNGYCPDILWRMKLSKQVETRISEITNLNEEARFEQRFLVDKLPLAVERVPLGRLHGKTSTDRTVEAILKCITDINVQKIGVWGVGGVGKTTVMKVLNNMPEIAKMFQMVIWVTVSRDWSVRKVLDEIARRLSLYLENNESNERAARKIFQKLDGTKYLLLLDDVWHIAELEALGVPSPSLENGCKILLTSRSLAVCKKMDTDKEIKVEVFSREEAWELFHKKVGDVVDSPKIMPLARGVVEECGGLPLAINVIGGSLRKVNDEHIWRNAFKELKDATFGVEDMEETVFKRLKFSYDQLKEDTLKNCFLYCALFPEDFEIQIFELIEYWRAEGFTGYEKSLSDAYDKGHAILNNLTDASLLEQNRNQHIKMHDLIRDMAIRITSSKGDGCRFLVRSGVGIKEAPKVQEWEQFHRISLMSNSLSSLPESPNCTLLSTLFLQNNRELKNVPELFFESMHNLRVLDLSETGIRSLPSSLGFLCRLQGLYLNETRLTSLPPEIGTLKELNILHISGLRLSCFETLPVEIGELTQLRSLRVTFTQRDDAQEKQRIPDGLLSRLFLLEDLRIRTNEQLGEISEVVAKEVANLKNLCQLEFDFPTLLVFENFIQTSYPFKNQSLTHFRFSVGSHIRYFENIEMEWEGMRYLRLNGGDNIPNVIVDTLCHATAFSIDDHKTAQMLSDFCLDNMNALESCILIRCNALTTLIDGNGLKKVALPNIKEMKLHSLPNLRTLWKGPIPPQSFKCLTELYLHSCPKLSSVLSRDIMQNLVSLKQLEVSDCSAIEEIVSGEYGIVDEDTVLLPSLTFLSLDTLPKLTRIWNGVPLAALSLKGIEVIGCPNLKNLDLNIQDTTALKRIEGETEWWEALEWKDSSLKQQLQPLFLPWNKEMHEMERGAVLWICYGPPKKWIRSRF